MNRKHYRIAPILSVLAACAVIASLASCGAKSAAGESSAGFDYAASESVTMSDMYAAAGDFSLGSYNKAPAESANQTMSETEQMVSTGADSARKLIRNVSMSLETREFDAFRTALDERIAACGGYVQSASVDSGGYYSYRSSRSASVTARIPADRLDEFCSGISGIANVVSRSENTSDVTLSYYDMESHMKALRSEYDTLLGILEKCTELSDVISVQSRITEVLYQIESYKTQLNNYDNLVSYSTVTLSVREVERETVVTEQTLTERMADGLSRTWESLCDGAQELLVDFVVNLPYLVLWGLGIAAVVLLLRAWIRRRKHRRSRAPKKDERKGDDHPTGSV